jgi:hypothetical protein
MSRAYASDYVEVAERLNQFLERYPDGSLQFEIVDWRDTPDGLIVIGRAWAYRTPDDPRPGIGWATEPVPGKTQFTRGSEVSNLETSCWGRAMAALGIATKKGIASANEVRSAQARQPEPADQPEAEPFAESNTDLLALIEAATTKDELNALVETIKAQPQPAQYRAAFMRRQKEVR